MLKYSLKDMIIVNHNSTQLKRLETYGGVLKMVAVFPKKGKGGALALGDGAFTAHIGLQRNALTELGLDPNLSGTAHPSDHFKIAATYEFRKKKLTVFAPYSGSDVAQTLINRFREYLQSEGIDNNFNTKIE